MDNLLFHKSLEVDRPIWHKGPRESWPPPPQHHHQTPNQVEDREALAKERRLAAEEAFRKNRIENRFERDGEAVVVKPLEGLRIPTAPPRPLEDLRKMLREAVKAQPQNQPQFAHVTDPGFAGKGLCMICPNSYHKDKKTVEVMLASDIRRVDDVLLEHCDVSEALIK